MEIKYSEVKSLSVLKLSLICAWFVLTPCVGIFAFVTRPNFGVTDVLASVVVALVISAIIAIILTTGIMIVRIVAPNKIAIKTTGLSQNLVNIFE